jgi:O-antigen/teichoic acid export membrane protein
MTAPTLKEKVLSGSIWSLVGSSGQQVFGLTVFIMLSRSLEPKDFGMLALALVFVEIIGLVNALGLEKILIRERTLTTLTKDTIFWIVVCLGATASAIVYTFSANIAHFLDIPDLTHIIAALSILPFLNSLSISPTGWQDRHYCCDTGTIEFWSFQPCFPADHRRGNTRYFYMESNFMASTI